MSLQRQVLTHNRVHHHSDYDEVSGCDTSENDDNNDEDKFKPCPRLMPDDSHGCGLVWRIVTILLCLPLCYPCYLTKKARQHYHKKEGTPKKLTRGRCGHNHHDLSSSLSHNSTLNDSYTSLTLRSQRSQSSDRGDKQIRDIQELSVMFLLSRTSNKLVSGLDTIQEEDRRPGVIGRRRYNLDDNRFSVTMHQELPSLKIDQEMIIGNLDLVVIVYSDMTELSEIVSSDSGGGIMNYIRQYWRGYFSLLLVQVGSPGDMIKKTVIEIVERDFSSCFRLLVNDPCGVDKILIDSCVRYYLHNSKLQCHKVDKTTSTDTGQSLHSHNWKCSGLCGLKNFKPELVRRKKRSVISAIKRKISRNET